MLIWDLRECDYNDAETSLLIETIFSLRTTASNQHVGIHVLNNVMQR